jgi:hypothetical protein
MRRSYREMRRLRADIVAIPLGLAVLVVWLAFHAGGFFAGATGAATLGTGIVLVLWLVLARRPLDALSRPLAILLAALIGFALWALLSGSWSDAHSRALIEFDRALLYVLAVAAAGLAASTPPARRGVLRMTAAALTIVCTCSLITRLLPHLWPVTPTVQPDRLSYPVTYWNTLGMLAALAVVACLHLASTQTERGAIRATAAAAIPILLTALFFTFSRGAIAVLPIGVIAYLVLARPRGAVRALLAIVPAGAVAVVLSYGADAVVEAKGPTAAAVSQGRTLAFVVLGCAVGAAILQVALAPVETRLNRVRLRRRPSRRTVAAALAACVLAVLAAGAVANVPHRVSQEIHRFTKGNDVAHSSDRRSRLTDVGNNGRIDHWRVALKAFDKQPLTGAGAGTYALLWDRYRDLDFEVNDGHSLYIEVLGELGIVGGVLIVLFVGTLLVGSALRIRGPDRAVAAAAFALILMWAIRAGIDWDWEMPVLTLPVLAIGAATLGGGRRAAAATATASARPWPGRVPRLVAAIGLLALLVTPLSLLRSQDHLDAAVADVHALRCGDAVAAALKSTDAVSVRPEPFEVLALCDVRLGRGDLALSAVRSARERDPHNWRMSYELAVIRASQGLDPRPALRRAREENPMSDLVSNALKRFDSSDPKVWRRQVQFTPFPL